MREPERLKTLAEMVEQDERVIEAQDKLNILVLKDAEWRENYPNQAQFVRTVYDKNGQKKVSIKKFDRKTGKATEEYGAENDANPWTAVKEIRIPSTEENKETPVSFIKRKVKK